MNYIFVSDVDVIVSTHSVTTEAADALAKAATEAAEAAAAAAAAIAAAAAAAAEAAIARGEEPDPAPEPVEAVILFVLYDFHSLPINVLCCVAIIFMDWLE